MNIRRALYTAIKKVTPARLRERLIALKCFDRFYLPYIFLRGKAWPPVQAIAEVTFSCNCRCLFCPINLYKEKSGLSQMVVDDRELSSDEWLQKIKELKCASVNILSFSGGEPFLKRGFLEMVRYAKELGFSVSVTTNGSPIDEYTAKALVGFKLDSLYISLDGPRSIHNHIRRINIFDSVMRAVDLINEEKALKKSRYPQMNFNCVINSINQGCLSELIKIGHQKKMPVYYHRLFYTTGQMLKDTERACPIGAVKIEDQSIPEDLKKVDIEILYAEIMKIKKDAKRLNVPYRVDIATREEIENSYYNDNFSFCNKCFYPWFVVCINPAGIVYPCSMNIEMGDLRKKKFSQIWNGPRFIRFRRNLKKSGLFPKCRKCCIISKSNSMWNILPKI